MRKLIVAVVALGLLAVVATLGVRSFISHVVNPFLATPECVATAGDDSVTLTLEQAQNAALIAAISVERGLPARAATIALATAYQESKLYNLTTGDRDSLGLFQQRPSQGWGTEAEVQNPAYATNAFYDALEQVDGWQDMPVTEAAQAVQRSAFPDAYADHEADARVLASALTGWSKAGFTCVTSSEPSAGPTKLLATGLTKRADRVRRELLAVFGDDLSLGGFEPGGVSSGHSEDSAHYQGRAVDVFFRPVTKANRAHGWAVASYLVAQADRLGIATVIYDAKIWTARRDSEGWRDYDIDTGDADAATRRVLLHRDHVHVDVFE
ncbi:hypothetical protein [Nocardioides sp. GY 10127]|uniref:hypothetical protein n=1 Tax=Nocardioides sp. GY 10127 TaxID=2569762 RepID=UPI0010A76A9D|nr:hypothetical protein [Nocardioides sp. GY 10127]TIC81668.1 hypothetical protein E8D37_10730 [Nocardioides sp. GY 10127]